MIILPTRRRLERRRDALYGHLISMLQHASIHQVEDIMRMIHAINRKIKTYTQSEHEPAEIFKDEDTA